MARHWQAETAEGDDQDGRVVAAVAALVLPVLRAIPNPLPRAFEFGSGTEEKRAAKVRRGVQCDTDRVGCATFLLSPALPHVRRAHSPGVYAQQNNRKQLGRRPTI